jgi:hypothetical protein
MMVNDRIYCRTSAGDRALESQRSVPEWFRAILVLVGGQVTSSAICSGMRGHSQKQVLNWVDQLETLGFVDRVILPPSSTPDAVPTEPDISETLSGKKSLLPKRLSCIEGSAEEQKSVWDVSSVLPALRVS